MITKSQYTDWKNDPVTVEYFNNLKEVKAQFQEELLLGHDIDSHARMAQKVGMSRAYDSAINYDPKFEDGHMVDDEGKIVE